MVQTAHQKWRCAAADENPKPPNFERHDRERKV
jgi:hypothetical protein